MKFIILVALTIQSAFALDTRPLFCQTNGAVADAGYNLHYRSDTNSASLMEITFAGASKVAELECVLTNEAPAHPDAIINYAVCTKALSADNGILIKLFNGGIAGLETAEVFHTTVMPDRIVETRANFGSLSCKVVNE